VSIRSGPYSGKYRGIRSGPCVHMNRPRNPAGIPWAYTHMYTPRPATSSPSSFVPPSLSFVPPSLSFVPLSLLFVPPSLVRPARPCPLSFFRSFYRVPVLSRSFRPFSRSSRPLSFVPPSFIRPAASSPSPVASSPAPVCPAASLTSLVCPAVLAILVRPSATLRIQQEGKK